MAEEETTCHALLCPQHSTLQFSFVRVLNGEWVCQVPCSSFESPESYDHCLDIVCAGLYVARISGALKLKRRYARNIISTTVDYACPCCGVLRFLFRPTKGRGRVFCRRCAHPSTSWRLRMNTGIQDAHGSCGSSHCAAKRRR